jgi:hypothetical protein
VSNVVVLVRLLIADAISFAGKRDSQGNLLFKLIYYYEE